MSYDGPIRKDLQDRIRALEADLARITTECNEEDAARRSAEAELAVARIAARMWKEHAVELETELETERDAARDWNVELEAEVLRHCIDEDCPMYAKVSRRRPGGRETTEWTKERKREAELAAANPPGSHSHAATGGKAVCYCDGWEPTDGQIMDPGAE